jgi:hypothetical protein
VSLLRQKRISATLDTIERALDQREALLAKLVRIELKIRILRRRAARAQKAFVASGDASVVAGVAPSPYTGEREVGDEFSDEIGL